MSTMDLSSTRAPPTAPASPLGDGSLLPPPPPTLLAEQSANLPTPPTSSSSSSSIQEPRKDVCRTLASKLGGKRQVSRRPSMARVQSGNLLMPLRTKTFASDLTARLNITTKPTVHASHLSNPTSRRSSTTPPSPTDTAPSFSAFSSLTSNLETIKLTDGATSPLLKSTPPLTPRALSNDGSETLQKSSSPSGHQERKITKSDSNDQVSSRPAPPVAPPKGKLFVKIISARGLKPSHSPYAVCSFEWIESIAHEPQQDAIDNAHSSNGRELDGGVPIKRTGGDVGRAMAIPMKSRQSSTTSVPDQKSLKNGKQVTDPKWDHEAVL